MSDMTRLSLSLTNRRAMVAAASFIDPVTLFGGGDDGLWMDAEQGLLDQSGKGNDLSGANEPTQVQLGNGAWVQRFDGVDDGVGCTFGAWLTQPFTLCAAYSSATGANYALTDGDNSGRRLLQMNQAGTLLTFYAGAIESISGEEVSAMSVTTLVANGSSSTIRKNGVDITPVSPVFNIGTHNLSGLNVGHDFQGNSHLDGDVAQLLLIDRELTAQEIADLEARFKDSSQASY